MRRGYAPSVGKRSRRAISGAAILAVAIALTTFGRLGPTAAQDGGVSEQTDETPPEAEVEVEDHGHVLVEGLDHDDTQDVIVGCYVNNVEAIDLHSNSYSMSAELWMKWRGPIDPTSTFRLRNVLDESSLTMRREFEHPIEVDGHYYQRFHIEGRFFHKFWLGTFPLDWQRVTLELEETHYPANVVRYVPDQGSSGVDPVVRLPGWRILEEHFEASVIERPTDYGMGAAHREIEHARYELSIKIERPVSFYFFKIIPPILITLACCLLVFLLRPSYVDARVGTPIAGLLTAVFLQLTFTGSLPNLGLMLLLDHVFNLTYAVIFAVALSCIVTSKSVDEIEELRERADEASDAKERGRLEARVKLLDERMHRINRRTMVLLPAVYLIGVFVITVAVRGPYFFEMLTR